MSSLNINIENKKLPIAEQDFMEMCESLKRRTIKILHLKDAMLNNEITEYDVISYIHALIWDMYGAYMVFENFKFLNCICELEGIKENLHNDFTRKKVLDLGSFILLIPQARR